MNNNIDFPEFTLEALNNLIQGQIIGDLSVKISGFAANPEVATKNQICFVFSKQYIELLNQNKLKAGAYIVPLAAKITNENINAIAVERPKLIIKLLLDNFVNKPKELKAEIHSTAIIDETAIIGKNVVIGSHVYIGKNTIIKDNTQIYAGCKIGDNVSLGKNSILKYNVIIEHDCLIGNNVIIHPQTVIGSDGFSFVTQEKSLLELLQEKPQANLEELFDASKHENNPQLKVISAGKVIIKDNVEIGANTCIDRGTLGATVIGEGSKIDNLVQIAHNVQIGKDCLIVAQAGIAGSTKLEDRVVIAGHAGCKDGIKLGHDSILLATSHAHKDAEPFSMLGGNPAIPAKEYLNKEKQLKRIMRDVPKIKEKLKNLNQ